MHTLLNFSPKTLQAFDPRRDIHLFCSCFASSAGAKFQDAQLLNWLYCKSKCGAEMETSVPEEEERWKRGLEEKWLGSETRVKTLTSMAISRSRRGGGGEGGQSFLFLALGMRRP